VRKISLGVRQLEGNPWDEIDVRFPIGTTVTRPVRNLTAYGAPAEALAHLPITCDQFHTMDVACHGRRLGCGLCLAGFDKR
jgi:hypothetical protein